MQRNDAFWAAQVADKAHKKHYKSYPNEHFIRYLRSCVGPVTGEHVLDFGFCTGTELLVLAKEGAICHGFDIAPEAVGHAARLFAQEGMTADLQSDFSQWPQFPLRSFKLVYALESLHYLADLQRLSDFLHYAHDLLKPGGHFLCSLPTPRHFFCKVSAGLTGNLRVFNDNFPERAGVRFITLDSESLIRETFAVFAPITLGYYEYCFEQTKINSFWFISGQKHSR